MSQASEPVPGGSLLTISAEIVSLDPEGFIIKIHNDETDETLEAKTVREYAEYLVQSVNRSARDNFVARWLPSPNARRYDIDLIGMQLGMMEEWMQKELGGVEDDGGLAEAMQAQEEEEA
ncbi:MAG TPA: hypothetical protein ENJ74_01350, partial [Nitratifractor salsuginis]|nr:hypothetical protein [Nitratifractor salsuginis]